MTGEELLAALTANEVKRKRGRPRANTIGDLDKRTQRLVIKVFKAARAAGGGRGTITAATWEIALRENIKPETLKRSVTRHRHLLDSGVVAAVEHMDQEWAEFVEVRRRLGEIRQNSIVTGHVWRWFSNMPVKPALQFLRDNQINGHCPRWLIDALAARDFLSPNHPKTDKRKR